MNENENECVQIFKTFITLWAGRSFVLQFPLLDGLLGQQVVTLSALMLWAMFEVVSLPHKVSSTERHCLEVADWSMMR